MSRRTRPRRICTSCGRHRNTSRQVCAACRRHTHDSGTGEPRRSRPRFDPFADAITVDDLERLHDRQVS